MINNIIQEIFDILHIDNILQVSSEDTLDEELLKYVVKTNSELTIINHEINLLKYESTIPEQVTIKQDYGINQIAFEYGFDIALLEEKVDYDTLHKQLEILEESNIIFPPTIVHSDNYEAIFDFKEKSSESYIIKKLEENNDLFIIYPNNIKLDEKIDDVLLDYDLSIDDLEYSYEQQMTETLKIQDEIKKIQDQIDVFNKNKDNILTKGKINDYENNGYISGWIADVNSKEHKQAKITVDNQIFTIIANLFEETFKDETIIGNHGFKLKIPFYLMDNHIHHIQLIDESSAKIIDETDFQLDTYNNNLFNTENISEVTENIIGSIYETQYNNNRGLKNKFISATYPLSLLKNYKALGGIKNSFKYIKGYLNIKKNRLLDTEFYLKNNNLVRQTGTDLILDYIYYGFKHSINPNPNFDGIKYWNYHTDVKKTGLNPLIHYSLYGFTENRKTFKVRKNETIPDFTKNDSNYTKIDYNIYEKSIQGTINSDTNLENIFISIDEENYKVPVETQIYETNITHLFKFNIPTKYLNDKKHEILLKNDVGAVLNETKHNWNVEDFKDNFLKYLSYSLTDPILTLPLSDRNYEVIETMNNLGNYLFKIINTNMPLVSIIMLTYNHDNISIAKSIRSILNQKYENIELLVLVDSKDNNPINISEFNDNRIKIIEENTHIRSKGRNLALQHATGKYIMYLDPGNLWDNKYVKSMINAFRKVDSADAIYSGQLIYNEEKSLKQIKFGSLNKGLLKNRNYISLNAFCHKRNVYSKYGGFDETLVRFEDWDIIQRYVNNCNVYSIPILLSKSYPESYDSERNIKELKSFEGIVQNKNNINVTSLNKNNIRNISIIVLNKNKLEYLEKCIKSLLNIELNELEIIVADYNSDQNSTEFLNRYNNKLKLISKESEESLGHLLNKAISKSKKSNDILLLDSSVEIKKESIQNLQYYSYNLNKSGMIIPQKTSHSNNIKKYIHYANNEYQCDISLNNKTKDYVKVPVFNNGNYVSLTPSEFYCAYLKRDVYEKTGGFNETLNKNLFKSFATFIKDVLNYQSYQVSNANVYSIITEEEEIIPVNIKKHKITENMKQSLKDLISNDVDQREIPQFNKNSPLVSIIITNRNGEEHLPRLLTAIKQNTQYPNYEIIIIDNASTDNSLNIIQKHKKQLPITTIQNNKNQTFSYANNQGTQKAKGKYLLFLNNDTQPLNGWLNHLVHTAETTKNPGAIGARLIYPDCTNSPLNKEKSYTLQHTGIIFKEQNGIIKPYNKDNGTEIYKTLKQTKPQQIIAVTAATLLIQKNTYQKINGFNNKYNYGYEDVDLCLKLHKQGYKNIYNPQATLYHYEFGTQNKNKKQEIQKRRTKNTQIYTKKWNNWLKHQLLNDKINNNKIFTDQPLTIAFAVTQADKNTTAGDYFTAQTLAKQLKKYGWNIKYLPQHPNKKQKNWYNLDPHTDILITLLDSYDLTKIKYNNGLLITIAWIRNWFERWTNTPYINKYDIILASSQKACNYITQKTKQKTTLYPLATDPEMFNPQNKPQKQYQCDYCFTGSYWNAPREIINCLNPENTPYKLNIYGTNWNKIKKLQPYNKGFINYNTIPTIYASTKIVLDDANHVTREYGSVNSRIFDTIASGKLIITNGTIGNQELFQGQIPEYHTPQQLTQQLQKYIQNPQQTQQKIQQLQKIILTKHTYQHRAQTLKQLLTTYTNKKQIAIKIPTPNWNEKENWGDYHMAKELKHEFENQGYTAKLQILPEWNNNTDTLADMILVLRGLSKYTPKPQHYNIMWNISHPDNITIQEYNTYDHIYIASNKWAKHIQQKTTTPTEPLLQCTNTKTFYPEPDPQYKHQILFVGNSRKQYRKILKDLIPTPYELAVYGKDWKGIIPDKYIINEHINNNELHKAYSSCNILLNDHWPDMKQKGFISNRIFDATATGTTIITDNIPEITQLFPENTHTYNTPKQLKQLIKQNINKKTTHKTQQKIQQHTYKKRVQQILKTWN